MEPNKIENQFRKKLNSREIQPSASAWDRMDAMLTVAEKPKKKYTWLLIAAGFIGILLVGTIFFKQAENQIGIDRIAIANQNTKAPTVINNKINKNTDEIITVQKNFKTNSLAIINESKQEISKIKKEDNLVTLKNNPKHEKLAENTIINQKNEQKSTSENAIAIVVDERITVIDKPLKNEILLNQKAVIKIDATSLLSQVNGELELSFREKVVKTIAKNYKEVKVAVNNRNNQ